MRCVYAFSIERKRIEWCKSLLIEARCNSFVQSSCDFLCEDWNMTAHRENSNFLWALSELDLKTHRNCLNILMNQQNEYLDEWRICHSNEWIYTHQNTIFLTRDMIEKSRIDRIYVRADWFLEIRRWMIISLQMTDHCMIMTDYCLVNSLFNKSRFRMIEVMLRSKMMLKKCRELLRDSSKQMTTIVMNQENRQNQCDVILKEWKSIKTRVKQIMIMWQRRIDERVRSRKHTLRLQAQQSNRSTKKSETLLIELAELKEDDRVDYCHTTMIKEYILSERFSDVFYERVKASRRKNHAIRLLMNSMTRLKTDDVTKMLEIARDFYEALYIVKLSDKKARRELLWNLDQRVESRFRQMLFVSISESKIRVAISKKKLSRFSRKNELSHDWYKNVNTLRVEMMKMLEMMLNVVQNAKRLCHWWKRRMLTLLYKKNNSNEIWNYWSLFIMRFDYRLYTMLLFERLIRALEMIIADHQVTFLSKRQIENNIKLMQCVIDKYRTSKKEIEVLFLNQEKIYDRVSHAYLWKCLRAFEVSKRFIHRVKTLYVENTMISYINEHKEKEIVIRSEVRQKNVLSCLLFNISIEFFTMMIKRDSSLQEIELSRRSVIKQMLYANDVTLFFRGATKLTMIAKILRRFERAFEIKVNWEKFWFLALRITKIDQLSISVQVLSLEEIYTHLRISMKMNVKFAMKRFLNKMIIQMRKNVER